MFNDEKQQTDCCKKNTVCYKELCCVKIDNKKIIQTPFQHDVVDRNILDGKRPYVAYGSGTINNGFDGKSYLVSDGYIHTFSSLFLINLWSFVLAAIKNGSPGIGDCIMFYKCIIPAGTEYFESDDGYTLASDKIIFKKKIKSFYVWKEHIIDKIKYKLSF